jgi:hypothetical protein
MPPSTSANSQSRKRTLSTHLQVGFRLNHISIMLDQMPSPSPLSGVLALVARPGRFAHLARLSIKGDKSTGLRLTIEQQSCTISTIYPFIQTKIEHAVAENHQHYILEQTEQRGSGNYAFDCPCVLWIAWLQPRSVCLVMISCQVWMANGKT